MTEMIAAITFDWTISFGSIIAMSGIMLSVIVAMWRNGLVLQMGLKRLESLEAQVSGMDHEVRRIAVMQQQLLDGKERMDGIDERVREVERARR